MFLLLYSDQAVQNDSSTRGQQRTRGFEENHDLWPISLFSVWRPAADQLGSNQIKNFSQNQSKLFKKLDSQTQQIWRRWGSNHRRSGDQTRSASWAQITQRHKNEAVREWKPVICHWGALQHRSLQYKVANFSLFHFISLNIQMNNPLKYLNNYKTFGWDILLLRMNPNGCRDALTSPLAPPWGGCLWFWVKHLSCRRVCDEMRFRRSCSPEDEPLFSLIWFVTQPKLYHINNIKRQ